MRGSKIFDYSFMGVGLIIQVATFFIANTLHPGSVLLLSLISGCLGVFSVCLTAQRNILMYVFGFAQILTYTYLCFTQRFYGEMAINAYYFVTMIYGVTVWKKELREERGEWRVQTRRLSVPVLALILALTLLLSWLTGWGLAAWTDDTQPYLDAFTTVPALVAQVLMIMLYREHWFIWLAVDILSVALWLRAGDYCLAAQYAFWCANCVYGLYRWKP